MIRLSNNARNGLKNIKNMEIINNYSDVDYININDIYKANYYFLSFNQSNSEIYYNHLKSGHFHNLYTMMLLNAKNITDNPVRENKSIYQNKDKEKIVHNNMNVFLVVNFNCSEMDVVNMMKKTNNINELIQALDCESVVHKAINNNSRESINLQQQMRSNGVNYCIRSIENNKSVLYYNYDQISANQYINSIEEKKASHNTSSNILIILSYF